jgi:hypothetical protein
MRSTTPTAPSFIRIIELPQYFHYWLMTSLSWFTAIDVPALMLAASFGSFLPPFVELAIMRHFTLDHT